MGSFDNSSVCKETSSSYPRILTPETQVTAQDIAHLSQEMYNRLPYIRAAYRPLFEEMVERRKSLAAIKGI